MCAGGQGELQKPASARSAPSEALLVQCGVHGSGFSEHRKYVISYIEGL